MINTSELKAFFSQFLLERGVSIEDEALHQFNFMQSGQLDSFEMLSMVIQLESTFGVKLTPEQMLSQQGATVGGLISLLTKA